MRNQALVILGVACILFVPVAVVLLLSSPAHVYRLTGSQHYFNLAVSGAVPRGGAVTRLRAVVGPGAEVAGPPWLLKTIQGDPARFPDGWREGDGFVSYTFPGNSTWYFQVRDGRLVNYD